MRRRPVKSSVSLIRERSKVISSFVNLWWIYFNISWIWTVLLWHAIAYTCKSNSVRFKRLGNIALALSFTSVEFYQNYYSMQTWHEFRSFKCLDWEKNLLFVRTAYNFPLKSDNISSKCTMFPVRPNLWCSLKLGLLLSTHISNFQADNEAHIIYNYIKHM